MKNLDGLTNKNGLELIYNEYNASLFVCHEREMLFKVPRLNEKNYEILKSMGFDTQELIERAIGVRK
ncbi:MAG: hypothetical protein RR191_05510 [Cetobacterium sp.]|uniref:hypothetical protein n=1 Tax=Cetobacterium sp. TaxID=2071632 RepID=UPI002FC67A30